MLKKYNPPTYNNISFHEISDINIVFRGGTGGNFFHYFISTYLLNHEFRGNYDSLTNEYYDSVNNELIGHSHINMWFRGPGFSTYGSERYTASRYKERLRTFKNKKLIIIQNTNNYVFTENLAVLKHIVRFNLPDLIHAISFNYKHPKHLKYDKHHRFLSWIARKNNIKVLDIEYHKIVHYDTENQLKKMCNFLEVDYDPNYKNIIESYHRENLRFIQESGYNFELISS